MPLFLERANSPWTIGAHVSAAGGVENAVLTLLQTQSLSDSSKLDS